MPWLRDFDTFAHNAKVARWKNDEAESAARDKNLREALDTIKASSPAGVAAPPPPVSPVAAAAPSTADARASGRATRDVAGSVVLPWPPSGNTAIRHGNGAHYIKPEVAQYRRHVAALCARLEPVLGRYILHVHLSPPDRRARDMDNALKTLNDALVRSGWLPDDSMFYMRELHVTTDDARQGAAIVRVEVIEGPKKAA